MDLLDRLLGHDAWTTRQLLARCQILSDEQLDREFDIGHRTVRATLAHIIRNVHVWSRLMAGRPVDELPGQSIAELTAAFDEAAAELAAVARSVAQRGAWSNSFLDVLDNPPSEKSFGGGIAHVITHSMHHRAQLLYMLRRIGLQELPEGDVLSWEQRAVSLREVQESDLTEFFNHQGDPVAVKMAAFPPRDCESFRVHWARILADPNVIARTVLLDSAVAGNLLCWEESGERFVGYWLGRSFWGQGIASRALTTFIASIAVRPLHARVTKHNLASIRVLEKAGFQRAGERRAAAPTGGEVVDEFLYVLVNER